MTPVDERRLLILDAKMLLRQYEARNEPYLALTAEQRKLWASEMPTVMGELVKHLEGVLPDNSERSTETIGVWNVAMKEGRRLMTFKVPSGPVYGGKKLTPPPFKDDPADPRGR